MWFVVKIEIVHNSHVAEWTSNSIDDENQGNQEAENLISKSSAQDDDAIQINKCPNKHENGHPSMREREEYYIVSIWAVKRVQESNRLNDSHSNPSV